MGNFLLAYHNLKKSYQKFAIDSRGVRLGM